MKSQKGSTQYRLESYIVDHLYQQDPHLPTHIMPSSIINLKDPHPGSFIVLFKVRNCERRRHGASPDWVRVVSVDRTAELRPGLDGAI